MRTTFFVAQIVGPIQPNNSRFVAGHRAGHWSPVTIRRAAERAGIVIQSAYSVPRDSKGFLNACKVTII